MSIRKKTIIFFVIIFTALVVTSSIIVDLIISNEFGDMDMEKSVHTNNQAVKMINSNFEAMMPFTHDWAYWDCLYEYVQGLDDRFPVKNFNSTTLSALEIHAMYILDLNGNIVHKELERPDGTNTSSDVAEYDDVVRNIKPILELDDSNHYVNGYIAGTDNVYFVSAHTILTSTGEGPYQGILLILKRIPIEDPKSNVFISYLEHPVLIHDLTDETVYSEYLDITQELETKDHFSIPVSSTEMQTYSTVKDMFGEPILLIETVYNRNIYQQGQKLLYYTIGSIVIIGFIFALLTYINFDKEIVSGLGQLRDFMAKATTNKMKLRLNLRTNAELSELSDIINRNLDKIVEQQEQLQKNNAVLASNNEQLALKQQEIAKNNQELTELNQAMIGREMKMVELKKEVEMLREKLGQIPLQ